MKTKRRKCCWVNFCCVVRLVGCWRFFPCSRSIAFPPVVTPFCSVLSACELPHALSLNRPIFSLSWNEHGPLTWRHTSQSRSANTARRGASLFNINKERPSWQARSSGWEALIKNKLFNNFTPSCPDDAYVRHPGTAWTCGHIITKLESGPF